MSKKETRLTITKMLAYQTHRSRRHGPITVSCDQIWAGPSSNLTKFELDLRWSTAQFAWSCKCKLYSVPPARLASSTCRTPLQPLHICTSPMPPTWTHPQTWNGHTQRERERERQSVADVRKVYAVLWRAVSVICGCCCCCCWSLLSCYCYCDRMDAVKISRRLRQLSALLPCHIVTCTYFTAHTKAAARTSKLLHIVFTF